MVASVSVWDRLPDADELLGARLARGWRPTATAERTGDRVLGHAACVLPPDQQSRTG